MAKNTKPTVRVHNLETDEIIDREMTNDELAQFEIDKANAELVIAQAQEKEVQREAILDRLGLTADEAKLLLG
jgi:hypothetical protein